MAFPFAFYAHRVDLILNEKFRATDFKKVFLFHSLKKRWNERELELLQRPEQKEPKEEKQGSVDQELQVFRHAKLNKEFENSSESIVAFRSSGVVQVVELRLIVAESLEIDFSTVQEPTSLERIV